MYIVDVDLPDGGHWGAEFTTPRRAGASTRGDRPDDVRRSATADRRSPVGQTAPPRRRRPSPTSAATSPRSRPTRSPIPAFYETSVADALAAKKPFVLVFATPKFCRPPQCGPTLDQLQAGRRGPPRRDVHQRRAIQAPGRRRPAPAGARRQRPAPGGRRHQRWGLLAEPWIFAVDRDGIVRGSYELTITDGRAERDPAGHHRRRLTPPQLGASSSRIATLSPPSVRYQTRTGCAVAWCSTRWPGGNSAPFSRSPMRNRASPVGRPKVEAADVDRAPPIDPDDHTDRLPWRRAAHPDRSATATEQERRGARHDDDDDEGEREEVPGAAIHVQGSGRASVQSAAPVAAIDPSRCCPVRGAASPSAQRGQVAGPGS